MQCLQALCSMAQNPAGQIITLLTACIAALFQSLQIHLKPHVSKYLWVRFVTDFSLVLPHPQPTEHHCSVPTVVVMLMSFRFSFQGAMPTPFFFLLWKDEWKVLNPNTLSSFFYHNLFPDVKTEQLSPYSFQT